VTPDTISSMSTSGGQIHPGQQQQSASGRRDKDLLNEYIRTPPTGSPRQGVSRAPSMNADGTKKATRPSVNCLSTPECHTLPEDMLAFAREKKIDLWAGSAGEGSDPLPSVHLHNTLQEFVQHLPNDFIQQSSTLGTLVPIDENVENGTREHLGVEVEWVLGVSVACAQTKCRDSDRDLAPQYTVLSKSRNVIEDKGSVPLARLARCNLTEFSPCPLSTDRYIISAALV
jgi:hypothetical protein